MTNKIIVEITRPLYEELLEDSMFLEALRQAGVAKWEGYSRAVQILIGGGN